MQPHLYQTTTTLPARALYAAIADIANWPQWDREIEETRCDEPIRPGAIFTLKPKGGPRVKLRIAAAEAPGLFADVAFLPLARMRTEHRFEEIGGATRITLRIAVAGPLGFLWDRLIARGQAAGAAAQTAALIAFAARSA